MYSIFRGPPPIHSVPSKLWMLKFQSEGNVTVRTRKYMTNRLLSRRQMVVDVLHPNRFALLFFKLLLFWLSFVIDMVSAPLPLPLPVCVWGLTCVTWLKSLLILAKDVDVTLQSTMADGLKPSERKGVRNSDSSDFRLLGFWKYPSTVWNRNWPPPL